VGAGGEAPARHLAQAAGSRGQELPEQRRLGDLSWRHEKRSSRQQNLYWGTN
jgi:hypothetical protein